MTTNDAAIAAQGLRKRYGRSYALDGLDLTVGRGVVHGLLGPNGAGKTTAVRILSTLLRFNEGSARVAGHDGYGLRGMRARVEQVGGLLEVVSAPAAGTTVRATVGYPRG